MCKLKDYMLDHPGEIITGADQEEVEKQIKAVKEVYGN